MLFQYGVEMMRQNPAGAEVFAICLTGQIATAAQQALRFAHGLFEVEFFEPVQRIVMHECAHGPVVGDDLARQPDQSFQLHPLGFAEARADYLCHSIISTAIR